MTNEEYQRQQRERRYREEREAAQRKGIEDYNRSQRELRARQAEASKRSYSRKLGEMGAIPSPFGPGVDPKAYREGKQKYEAGKRKAKFFSSPTAQGYAPSRTPIQGPTASSGASAKKGSGGALLFLVAIVAALVYFGSSNKTSISSSGSEPTTPVIYRSNAPSHPTDPTPTVTNDFVPPQGPPSNNSPSQTASPGSADPPHQADSQVPIPTTPAPATGGPDITASNDTNDQLVKAALLSPYERYQTPWPAEGIQFFAEHKGRKGCKGNLFLGADQLVFTCTEDSSRSFTVGLRDIQGQDSDGIKLYSGEKYHFKLLSAKEETPALFTEWVHRARLNQGLEH
jgi:hypothetical protein